MITDWPKHVSPDQDFHTAPLDALAKKIMAVMESNAPDIRDGGAARAKNL